MRALLLKTAGGTPEVGDFNEPQAKETGQEAVKVLAAGLNPVDRYMIQNPEPLPRVVGLEAIVKASSGKRLYVGSTISPFGSVAEKTLIKLDSGIELPDELDSGPALVIGIAGLVGWLPLSWKAKLRDGESVLVLGATGVQGQIAVQAAKLLGAGHVVAAGRNRDTLSKLKEHGADEIAVLEGDLTKAIKAVAPEGGYQVVIDSLFGDPFMALLDSGTLSGESRVVCVGGSAGQEIKLNFRQLQATKGAIITGYSSFYVPAQDRKETYLTMAGYIVNGKLQVEVKSYPLDRAKEAWQDQASGPHKKIIIEP